MNLILQHWSGEATDFERASWANIKAYAKRIGAEHAVVFGEPMGSVAFPQMHKLCMLTDEYDSYDQVAMLDSDMFTKAALKDDLFALPGIGVMGALQRTLRATVRSRLPALFEDTREGDYYGGAVYKLGADTRREFRPYLTRSIVKTFDDYDRCCDEGVMHYLASRAGVVNNELPDGEKWAYSSFGRGVRKAAFIHVRRRVEEGKEERQPKMQALKRLVEAGVIAL